MNNSEVVATNLSERELKLHFNLKYGNRIANPRLAAKLQNKFLGYTSSAQSVGEADRLFQDYFLNSYIPDSTVLGAGIAELHVGTHPQGGFKVGDEESNFDRIIKGIAERRHLSEQEIEQLKSELSLDQSMKMEEDLEFAKNLIVAVQMGLKAFRFSIVWEKVMTPEGVDLQELVRYKRHAEMCLRYGLEPVVVLHHFDLPEGIQWVDETVTPGKLVKTIQQIVTGSQTEWATGSIRAKFLKYANIVLQELIPAGVQNFIVINEPNVELDSRYLGRRWQPYDKNLVRFFEGQSNMSSVAKDTYMLAKLIADENETKVTVMTAINMAYFDTQNATISGHQILKWFAEYFDKTMQIRMYQHEDLMYFDVLGVQPYWIHEVTLIEEFAQKILKLPFTSPKKKNPKVVAPMKGTHGQLLNSSRIYDVIMSVKKRFPQINAFALTEFGADIGAHRLNDKVKYLEGAFDSIKRLTEQGIDVVFALMWTLFTNYELIGPDGGGHSRLTGEEGEIDAGYNFGIVGRSDFGKQQSKLHAVPTVLYPGMIDAMYDAAKKYNLVDSEKPHYLAFIDMWVEIFDLEIEQFPAERDIIIESLITQLEALKTFFEKSPIEEKDECLSYIDGILSQLELRPQEV